jgi:lysophospholipase L1-like esterase
VPGIKLRSGETVVFAGDSITESGRFQFPPLGNGYVYIFYNLLLAKHPELKVNVVNAGVSGNTVVDLKSRWEDDVLSLNPDWMSILIGINDIHRHLGGQPGFDPESYYRNYREILEMTRERLRGAKLVLLAPFYVSRATVGGSFRRKVLETLPAYVEKVEKLGREFGAIYVNLHAMFQELIKHREPTAYAPEAVHPTFAGHVAIALALMEALEER